MSIYQDHAYKHGIGWSTWHFQWVTKYRYNVFADAKLQKLCEIFLYEAAKRFRFCIEELEVAPNHVHVIATLRPSAGSSQTIGLIEGYTSRMLFIIEEKKLKKFYWREKSKRQLWGDGKFIASVGHITIEKAKEYVANHEIHHAKEFIKRNHHHLWLGRMSIFSYFF